MLEPMLKSLLNKIEPDADMENRLKHAVLSAPRRSRRVTVWHGIAAAAACAAVVLAMYAFPGTDMPGVPPAASTQSSPPANGEVTHEIRIQMYLSDDNQEGGASVALTDGVTLTEGMRCRIPNRPYRVRRGDLITNADGTKLYGVVKQGGDLAFTVDADNVSSISVFCERGSVSCVSEARAQAVERALQNLPVREDAPYWRSRLVTSFMTDRLEDSEREGLSDAPCVNSDVYRRLLDGEYNDLWGPLVEKAGFPAIPSLYLPEAQRAADGQVQIHLWIYPRIMSWNAELKDFNTIDCNKEGRFLRAVWQDTDVWNEITQYPPIPYESMTGDTLTIQITFTDKRVLTKQIRLSLDNEGDLTAELLK